MQKTCLDESRPRPTPWEPLERVISTYEFAGPREKRSGLAFFLFLELVSLSVTHARMHTCTHTRFIYGWHCFDFNCFDFKFMNSPCFLSGLNSGAFFFGFIFLKYLEKTDSYSIWVSFMWPNHHYTWHLWDTRSLAIPGTRMCLLLVRKLNRLMPHGFVNSLVIEPSNWEQVDELRGVSDQQSSAFRPLVLERIITSWWLVDRES
jgi:hypothetical protein